MNDSDNFVFRYNQLKKDCPSIVASGFWFAFVWLIARLFFFVAFAGLISTFLWMSGIIFFPKDVYYDILNSGGLQTLAAFFFFFAMITSRFAARMAKRVVRRNAYIASLEILVEEELEKGVMR